MAQIEIYVQPRAASTKVCGVHDGLPKVRLAAPPVDGAANSALIEYVAQQLGIAKSSVRILRGHSSRRKLIAVEGVEQAALSRALSKR